MSTEFGKYKLLRRIAVGGMAEVFLGVVSGEGGFRKYVAIKRILPHLTEEKDFINMFFDEARIMARFNHPHIVQIYDLGRVKNTYFLAMEYVNGLTMFRIINRYAKMKKRIPLEITARIIADVCDALDYAHNFTAPDGTPLEIVHRDVSAQNIMLSIEGVVKVLDFGVAKAVGNLSRTRPSWLKGKAMYMSPEQIEMKPIDRRSDIFSVGTLLYIMSTMHRPFQGESEYQVMMSIVNQPAPDPRKFNPQIPDSLVKIIEKALQKDPAARYQTAHEMQQDLEKFLEERKARVTNRNLATFLATVVPQLAEKSERLVRTPTQKLPSPLSSTPAIEKDAQTGEYPILLVPKEKSFEEQVLLDKKKTSPSEQFLPANVLEISDSFPDKVSSTIPGKVVTPISKPAVPFVRSVAVPVKTDVASKAEVGPQASESSQLTPKKAETPASVAASAATEPLPGSSTGVPFGTFTRTFPGHHFFWWTAAGLVSVVAIILIIWAFAGGKKDIKPLSPPQTIPVPQTTSVEPGPTPGPSETIPQQEPQEVAPRAPESSPAPAEQERPAVATETGPSSANTARPPAVLPPAELAVAEPAKPPARKATRPGTPTAAGKAAQDYQPQVQPEEEEPAARSSSQTTATPVRDEPSQLSAVAPPAAASEKVEKEKPSALTAASSGSQTPEPTSAPEAETARESGPTATPQAQDKQVAMATSEPSIPSEPVFQTSARMLARRIEGADPEYPRIARQARLEATLVARIDVSPEGKVTSIQFLKTHEAFEKAVRDAVEKWRFSPFLLKGVPVPTYTVYKFVFKLE